MKDNIKKSTLAIPMIALIILCITAVFIFVLKGVVSGEDSADIGKDHAKKIALEHAAVDLEDVTFTKCVLDDDDGIPVYDVEFYTNDMEYDYEIESQTGMVYSKETEPVKKKSRSVSSEESTSKSKGEDESQISESKKENVKNTERKEQDATKYIGVARAKEIALANAGISSSKAAFEKAKLSHDDGAAIYKIEFESGNVEYEYEIGATSGKIIEKSVEKHPVHKSKSSSSSKKQTTKKSSGNKHDDDDDDEDDDDD